MANTALIRLGRFKSVDVFYSSQFPFLRPVLSLLFFKKDWETLYFFIFLSKSAYQIAYAVFAIFYFSFSWPFTLGTLLFFFFMECVLSLISAMWSRALLQATAFIAVVFLVPLLPFLLIFAWIKKHIPVSQADLLEDKAQLKEIIRESELQHHLDASDQKLINSFIHFKERVAKEIMVPRVDLFSLSASTPIREATRLFAEEGYSRIPIYKDTLDQIVGVVLYKDLLKYHATPGLNPELPLDTLAKPVLYAPESKKASQLLQEFRNKQIHMAIIVDEYGGTEGVVTIEDILEELVGEIEDEYDIEEENTFAEIPGGGWIIDAKMTLLDIATQLGVHIPTHPDYETLGGYIYHCAGTIPTKGWRFSHDNFDLEIISSNERAIRKIKIKPRTDVD